MTALPQHFTVTATVNSAAADGTLTIAPGAIVLRLAPEARRVVGVGRVTHARLELTMLTARLLPAVLEHAPVPRGERPRRDRDAARLVRGRACATASRAPASSCASSRAGSRPTSCSRPRTATDAGRHCTGRGPAIAGGGRADRRGTFRRVRLAGESALVTGSTSGIGRAIAIEFAREGARVVVTGRDPERGDAVVARDHRRGRHARCSSPADLARRTACAELVARRRDAARRADRAREQRGRRRPAATVPPATSTTDAWDAILRVDLTAPMWLCRDGDSRTCARAGTARSSTSRPGRPSGRARASPRTSRPRAG